MKKLLMIFASVLSFCGLQANPFGEFKTHSFSPKDNEKMYIDESDLSVNGDAFHIHIGHNVWLMTNTVHRDSSGLYTFEGNLNRSITGTRMGDGYERKWKCPYCYHYWAIGTACQNSSCPSRYK